LNVIPDFRIHSLKQMYTDIYIEKEYHKDFILESLFMSSDGILKKSSSIEPKRSK